MKREETQTGEERTVETTSPISKETRDGEDASFEGAGQVGRNRENDRFAAAPGRFRVVSASGAFSVGVANDLERDARRRELGVCVETEERTLKNASRRPAFEAKKSGDAEKNVDDESLGDKKGAVDKKNLVDKENLTDKENSVEKKDSVGWVKLKDSVKKTSDSARKEDAAKSGERSKEDGWEKKTDSDQKRAGEESCDAEFDDENAFFASFSTSAETRRAANSFDAAFAGGLRSIFDAEADEGDDAEEESAENGEESEDDDASDAERFQRDFERERRESLDGVLLQNDADFLREAGEKYERPRVSDADFERKSASRFGVDGLASAQNVGVGRQNGGDGENSEGGGGGLASETTVARRVPIGPASILEAMLFVGDRENRPLTLARATELMRNVSETEAIEALADLNERYWRDGAPYRIVRDGDGFRMALRSEFDALATRMVGGKTKEFKLTQTMIDVLALIAYRQPISLDEILETRNNATGALAQLVKRELVAQEKRVVDKKKVAFYSTTPRFLRLFNLESLDDLPIVGDVDYR